MPFINILVTGSNGQLGQSLKRILTESPVPPSVVWADKQQLDISQKEQVEAFFTENQFTHCINAAAYTAVDKAEEEEDLAYQVNTLGAENIAESCQKHHVQLIHLSTDFVFGGKVNKPYEEDEQVFPVNIYGKTKWEGEEAVQENCPNSLIVRTSWLYSEFGKNFVKTMIRLGKEKGKVGVIAEQYGTPTYAIDLARFLWLLVEKTTAAHALQGVYHFSNEGAASWYDFAHAIFEYAELSVDLRPLKVSEYPTPAKRPCFSVLDKTKAKNTFDLKIRHWRDALKECVARLKANREI